MSSLSVNTNPSSFVALETLEDTGRRLAHTQTAISTGKKVATAADNPASFGTDQEISGDVAGQNAVNDGLSYAASLVNTSSSAADQIIGVLQKIRGAITAAGDVVDEGGPEADYDKEITSYLNQIDTISRAATSNGVNLLAGVTSNGYDITGTSLSYVTDYEGHTNRIKDAFTLLNPIIRQIPYKTTGGCFHDPKPQPPTLENASDYEEDYLPQPPGPEPQPPSQADAEADYDAALSDELSKYGDQEPKGVKLKVPLDPTPQQRKAGVSDEMADLQSYYSDDLNDWKADSAKWSAYQKSGGKPTDKDPKTGKTWADEAAAQADQQVSYDNESAKNDYQASLHSWQANSDRASAYKKAHHGHCPPIRHYPKVQAQTLSWALGLTNQNEANTSVRSNIFTPFLEGGISWRLPHASRRYVDL